MQRAQPWFRTMQQRGVGTLLFLVSLVGVSTGTLAAAQQVETSIPLSQRLTLNLAAGMPASIGDANATATASQSAWWFENTRSDPSYAGVNLNEATDSAPWKQVGLPYDANITRTFLNQTSGGGQGSLNGQENWYRLHFKVDPKYAGQRFQLELEGAHTGVQVYLNGILLRGISAVAANSKATHVVGFVPVVLDLSPYLKTDGSTDNVLAIDVSRGSSWFEQPGFSGAFRFGQAMAGLFRNVKLLVTNPVHIPLNVYSNQGTWGTYVGTVSIDAGSGTDTATAASALVEVQTNVLNETGAAQQVTLTTQIVDAAGNVVVTAPPLSQTVPAMTAGSFPSDPTPLFRQQITVPHPTLWYPNNSLYGKPYLYRVYHILSVNGTVVDAAQSPLGIRLITWDNNFPYFNGHQHYLWGGSGRYDYPALGSSVPDEQQWRDLAQFAAAGGNVWRPGHSTSSEEFVEAADAYGIMIDQPSGDGEGAFTNPSADDAQLKTELHRDMIIRDRSHPSILDWEMDNGGNNLNLAAKLAQLGTDWDNINPRQQASRAYSPKYAFLDECDGAGCEVGNKSSYPQNPAFGAEYWDNTGTGRGLAWDSELAFAAGYLKDWRDGRAANTFGMAQWYFADTPGEVALWAEYANTPSMSNFVRSLGYSMVDQNRFPRLLYSVYAANWIPYAIKPVVALAHHWNRGYEYTPGTPLQVNAFSNCPAVRLLVNGAAKDPVTGTALADQTPNPWNIVNSDLTQATTTMPGQVHWRVNWAAGSVTAVCLGSDGNPVQNVTDTRVTAGAENKIVLSVVPELTKPDGSVFQWTANGSDAAFIRAEVQDAQGNLVPTAADNVTFTVQGPAQYMGGTQQVVSDPASPLAAYNSYYQDAYSQAHSTDVNGVPYALFHAPGDPELQFEGGLQKIALRSTLTPGTVTVTATAPGLASGTVQLNSSALPAPVQTQAPAIIVPPVNTAVTAGYPAQFTVAASGSGSLTYQWFVNGTSVAGATGTTFNTGATATAQNGETIAVTVSSQYGTVSSGAVTLTVQQPQAVSITSQPAAQAVVVGQTATFAVVATGSAQLNYAWYLNNGLVSSGTASSYTTPALATAGTQTVYVVVSNPLGQVQSSAVQLVVSAPVPVSFTAQPAGAIVAAGQPVQLSATVTGSAPYTYQWQFTPQGGTATILNGATTSSGTITYTLPAMTSSAVGSYAVVVNNAANTPVASAAAQVSLAPPGVNLALNRPATSSSMQGACNDGTTAPPFSGENCLGAENAVDGDLKSRWASRSAGAPPATSTSGVDPSWLSVDLGSIQPFNTVVLNWENAYAAQYQIQYTNTDPASTDTTWSTAFTQSAGTGGVETVNFPTVRARYLRMLGTQRATQYGYSLWETQVYNVAQCGGSAERYTVNAANTQLVLDNLLQLTWTRTVKTSTTEGGQFTGLDAASYCSSVGMRLPTQGEALGISGNNNASCAFPGAWNTWTSTVDPSNANNSAIVSFDGTVSEKVTSNWPGATLCVSGSSSAQAVQIQTQPQPVTVTAGQQASFTVAATGTPAPAYQWLRNGQPIAGGTAASYTTPVTTTADSGAQFSVTVANSTNAVTSAAAVLTVTAATAPTPTPAPGNPGDTAVPGFANGPVPAGPNLALKRPVVSSGDENAAAFPPAAATDGDFTTRWSSAFNDAAWLQIDLGAAVPVGQVVLRWERAYGVQYLLQTSSDAVNWTTAYTQTAGQGATENLVFAPVTARYVRLYGVQRSSQYGYSLWEFEVYGPVAPSITTQPASQTVPAGSQARFTVVAGGTGPFTYQWLRNGTALSGATAASYLTPALSSSDSGSTYAVVVGNTGGSVTSSAATLTVTNPQPGTSNLALYKPVMASGAENSNLAAANAVDGSLSTRWSSNFADNAWLEVDLGQPMLVNKVVLNWEAAFGKQYQLQISGDEQTWSPVFTQTQGAGGVETLTFPGQIARYVRLQGVQRATQYGYSLYEFQIYGVDTPSITMQPADQSASAGSNVTFAVAVSGTGPFTYQWLRNGTPVSGATASSYTVPSVQTADNGSTFGVVVTNASGSTTSRAALLTVQAVQPSGTNLALHKPAYSSGNENANNGPALAFDGNLQTRWSSAFTDASWIYVDLGSLQSVHQVILRWEAAFGKSYQLQVSPDAANWTTVYTQTAGTGGTENISFNTVSARYVRLLGVQRGTAYGYSLWEFEVYGPTATSGGYTVYPGFVGVDLQNNTGGAWTNDQVYVTVIGLDPATNRYAYLKPDGTVVDFTTGDSTAPGHLTQGSVNYGNYSFTLAQSTLLKIPTFISARAYISLGAPLYVPVYANAAGQITSYAGPNPQNGTDPNVNTHFDWYEFNNQNGLYINTTQVDQFGLPLTLDVWASSGSFHQRVGITETLAQLDSEYASEMPAAFQPQPISNLRILSPAKLTFGQGGANAHYFDSVVAQAWASYASTPLTITLSGRTFSGTASGSTLTFTEQNPSAAHAGETFLVQQPSTQDILGCAGTMATGVAGSNAQQGDENAVQLQLQNQICSALNRGVLLTPASWADASAYYVHAPANFYSAFWHRHSLGGLAYGYSYDDNNNQSTTIATPNPEHMAWGIGW